MPGIDPVSIGLAAVQTGYGIYESIAGAAKAKKLMRKRKAYQTPQEIYEILQATEANAQQGYDSQTLNYLTGQTDQAFSSSLAASTRMGGDPNSLSGLFSQKMNAMMKIGADNHSLQLANFSQYLDAKGVLADNKVAEWRSREDMLKDEIQQAVGMKQEGMQNIQGGINTALSAWGAYKTGQLGVEGEGTKAEREAISRYLSGASFREYNTQVISDTMRRAPGLTGGSLAPRSRLPYE